MKKFDEAIRFIELCEKPIEDYLNWKEATRTIRQEFNKLQSKIWDIEELLDFTPKDIRDVATYTYEELRHILDWEDNNE